MEKKLNWKKRSDSRSIDLKTKYTHQTNGTSQSPLFAIEKKSFEDDRNKYRLYHSIGRNLCQFVASFKTQKAAKLVAELIYKDSIHASKKG